MEFSDCKMSRIKNMMKKDRLAYKAKENAAKPSLVSDDVLETANFTFAKTMTEREGDSGQLLLAKRRTDHSEQYLVKHAFTDCAANEFVYTKLVQAMDYHMPDAKLFQLSPGEKRTCFKTEYIIGTKYLNVIDMCPDFDVIRSMAQNWQDFFGFRALYTMLLEGDGMEVLLADDGCIYRVDTSDAFTCNNRILDNAGVDRLIQGVNLNTAIKNMLFSKNYDRLWNNASFNSDLQCCMDKYGNEYRDLYLKPFSQIQDIPDIYIDGFLNTLCYFYPDYIGDYYKLFIHALQNAASEYLRNSI